MRPLSKNLFGISTCFDLMYSHKFFPRLSKLLVELNPRSRWSLSKKCTARMFGNSHRSICFPLSSFPSNSLNFPTLSTDRSQSHSSSCLTNSPRFAFELLSPDRPITTYPKGARVVGPKLDKSTGDC